MFVFRLSKILFDLQDDGSELSGGESESEDVMLQYLCTAHITFVSWRFTILIQINIIQITNLQPSFYKSDQMLVFGERGKPEYPGENLS